MKIFILFAILAGFIFFSCSNKGGNTLVLSNHDTYAYQIDTGWEVNTSVIVKGFKEEKRDDRYFAKLGYTVDMVTADGKTIKSIAADTISINQNENILEIPVKVQVDIDSTYNPGKYKIIFNIVDKLSDSKITSEKELELE